MGGPVVVPTVERATILFFCLKVLKTHYNKIEFVGHLKYKSVLIECFIEHNFIRPKKSHV